MMGETTFLIVPFDCDADGKLQPGAPARLETEDAAAFAVEQFASFHAGIAIIEEPLDIGIEPRFVAAVGRIPAETLKIFGLATKIRNRVRLLDQARDFALRAAAGVSVRRNKRRALGALSGRRDWLMA